MTDKEYVNAFLNNDQKKIAIMYEKFEKPFKRTIKNKFELGNTDVLSDIYQEAVTRLWLNIQDHKLTEANLSTDIGGYLYGIGEKVMLERLRKQKEVSLDLLDNMMEVNDWMDSEYEYNLEELRQSIRDVVFTMKEPCHSLLHEFYWDQRSWEEIAIRLGYANANSAKTQKNKCMSKLKSLFQ